MQEYPTIVEAFWGLFRWSRDPRLEPLTGNAEPGRPLSCKSVVIPISLSVPKILQSMLLGSDDKQSVGFSVCSPRCRRRHAWARPVVCDARARIHTHTPSSIDALSNVSHSLQRRMPVMRPM